MESMLNVIVQGVTLHSKAIPQYYSKSELLFPGIQPSAVEISPAGFNTVDRHLCSYFCDSASDLKQSLQFQSLCVDSFTIGDSWQIDTPGVKRVGFQTRIDGCHPVVCDKLDQHHALTSHSKHSLQHTKMPALLLRLDSVGEVSTVKLPSNSTTSDIITTASSRPRLHNSKSFDCDIASRATRRLLSSPTMAKLLSPNKTYRNSLMPRPVQTESYGFDAKSSESGSFYGRKAFSSSFDSSPTNSYLHNMNTILTPSKINEYNLFGSQSHQAFKDLDTILPSAGSCSLSTSIFSIAAACTACRLASTGCSVSASAQSTPLEKDSSLCVTISPEIPVTEALCQTCESKMAPLSTSLEECAPDHSSLSVVLQSESKTDESNIKSDDAGGNALPIESVLNVECEHSEECSGSCDKLTCDSTQNSTSGEASSSCLSSLADLSSVLSTPRKTTKKGRPSSKKQRKRQREKQKTCSVPLVSKLFMSSNEAEKMHLSNCSQSEEDDGSSVLFEVSGSLDSTPRVSTPVKSQSKHCPIASFIFGRSSDSEETDADDVSEDGHEWSAIESEKTYSLPKKCAGFNAPLNLHTVFKRKSVPTLRSIFWGEDSESESEASPVASPRGRQSPTLDTSKDEHSEDSSVEFSSPVSSPSKSFGFACGLSIEALFTKKPDLACPNVVKESIFDTVDGVSSNAESCQLSTSFEMCYESIRSINAKWNENYPSAGFRSCLAMSSDEITDPNIKVHFASGPSFLTVHIIGTEERAGTWHHFALDRERFKRRILDLTSVLSPVLEASHRAKVLSRNQQM